MHQSKQCYEPKAKTFQLCQCFQPAEPHVRVGVDCGAGGCQVLGWKTARPIPWQALTQGEYVGPPRSPHVAEYLVRVGDQIEFIYRRDREISNMPYRLNVGDTIRLESMIHTEVLRELVIQSDGKIVIPPAKEIRAAGRTIKELTEEVNEFYEKPKGDDKPEEPIYRDASITITPIDTERKLQDLLAAVDSRFGNGGLQQQTTVTPEGTVQLPGIGNVIVQGLSLDEIQREVEERYAQIVPGIGVDPRLSSIAAHFIYVGGEVQTPNRFEISTPTTVIMAIAMAGGWNYGGNLREVVIFRRAEDWRLIATKVNLRNALLGKAPCPEGEIFLRDSDIVYVPKGKLLLGTDFVDLLFTRGIYGVIPLNHNYSWNAAL